MIEVTLLDLAKSFVLICGGMFLLMCALIALFEEDTENE